MIAGDVGSSCEVRPWLKASVADTDYSILDMWGKTILAQACEAKAKLIRLSWRWSSDAISLRMSSGRRRSGGSDSALPQSKLWNGVQDEVEDKQYRDNGGHLSRVYNKHDCRGPQPQQLLRVVDKTQQLIRRPNILKEHYHQRSMHIQKLIDARGVYDVYVTFHAGNFW